MDASLAKPLDGQGYSSAIRRRFANTSVATLVAGIITFGQWLIVDRPQQGPALTAGRGSSSAGRCE
jgi:hypothetical protein